MSFLLDHPIDSPIVIAHVRKATKGARILANTQPFARELRGRLHVFAHNGMLPGIERLQSRMVRFTPIGDTDSEAAFCALLDRIERLWNDPQRPPSVAARRELIAGFAHELRDLGPANFVYCDSDALFAHADRRTQRDGLIRPPGLHWSCPDCVNTSRLQLAGVDIQSQSILPRLALVASVPLSDDGWSPLASGELLALKDGRPVR